MIAEGVEMQPSGSPAPVQWRMDVSHLLDELNPAQREAVSAPPGHYLVLAGAGSGKTRVLTHRIGWLVEVVGVPAHGVLAVTFTNKAAAEMRGRVGVAAAHGTRGMWVGTFHGLAHRLLRLHWREAALPECFQVLDSDDQLRLVKRIATALELDEGRFPPRQIAWWINAQKDEGRRPKHIQVAGGDFYTATLLRVYEEYEERCQRAGLVDFAEILLRALELLARQRGPAAPLPPALRAAAGRRVPGHQQRSSTPSCACWPATPARSSWSATTTRRSTAGAAPRSRTCSASCATTRARRPSSSSRTTARPATSSPPPTR